MNNKKIFVISSILLSLSGCFDTDGDGRENGLDAHPHDPNEDGDTDGDGVGDNRDAFSQDPRNFVDYDEDGYGNADDMFPFNSLEYADDDSDGIGNYTESKYIADAGENLDISVGEVVLLNGKNSSTLDNSPLLYSWQFSQIATGSTANIHHSNFKSASFVPDVKGTYEITLTTYHHLMGERTDTVTIVANEKISD